MKEVQFYLAHDRHKRVIHIDDAISGANGYHCMGCGAQMIASKAKINQHHFRHHPRYKDATAPCTYSDETYRHKLAKEILQRLRRVKVPAVYGIPPAGYEGRLPRLLPEQFIEAQKVFVEHYIYRTETGDVLFGRDFPGESAGCQLLIKPDLIFCVNQGGRDVPKLLIELKATNAVDDEKQAKLYSLGVDAVEITIPPASRPEDIEAIFSSTKHTRWLYNAVQANTPFQAPAYSSLQRGEDSVRYEDGISFLYRETRWCRKFRLEDAIRGIRNAFARPQRSESLEELEREENELTREGEELRAEEAALDAEIGRTEQAIRERDHRTDSVVQERVGRMRATYQEAEAGLVQDDRDQQRRHQAETARIDRIANYLAARQARTYDSWAATLGCTRQDIERALRSRKPELVRLENEERAISLQEEQLRTEEEQVEQTESSAVDERSAIDRAIGEATEEAGRLYQALHRVQQRKAELIGILAAAREGRLPF